jgi:hypothetical protein
MSKKKAKQRRAGFRAGETKQAQPSISAELIKRSRKLVQLEAVKRAQIKAVQRTEALINSARQELKAAADAAVNDPGASAVTLPGEK